MTKAVPCSSRSTTHARESGSEMWCFYSPMKLLREIHDQLNVIICLLRVLVDVADQPPTSLYILRIGDFMLPFDPGTTGIKLQAVFLPTGSTTPPTFSVSWTSSDSNVTVVPDTTDPTGLTADVSIASTAVVGAADSITATANGANADGSPLSVVGTFTFTIAAAPASNPTSLGISQIA